MSDAWNQGYFTDAGYTYGYYREINPVFQRFCLLLRGFDAPEPDGGGTHAELGFGQGISFNIHAAANPGRYVGTDFNPSHVAQAQALAGAAGSGAQLHDDSFEQLLARDDLPQFDSISLHGIWTWVSRENHRVITEFVRQRLRPGGVLYLSYNCFPGWSPAYPLRQLFALHDRFNRRPEQGVAGRVDQAIDFAQRLLAAKPGYLASAPQLPARLEAIAKQDRHYLAHEYLNREWNCMYFTDVVEALAPAKLDYVGTAAPLDQVDAIHLRPDAQTFLASIESPILREQARDYFVSQQFRKDLYVRGALALAPAQRLERLLATRFILVQDIGDVALKVQGGAGEAALQEALYRPVLEGLASRHHAPKTMRELLPLLPEHPWAVLLEVLTVLVGLGAVQPCQSEDDSRRVRRACDALNRYLCDQAQYQQQVETLASPVTGGGIGVSRIQQLFLRAYREGQRSPAQMATAAWQVLAGQGQALVKDGAALATPEENLAELTRVATQFVASRLPILRALQMVA